ncbi:MAG: cysteine desulfurase [Bacteroidia bacterium]|nr:cysteine desulfurase [Bacteroidia bacterium]
MSTSDTSLKSKVSPTFDVQKVRIDFPILSKTAYDKPLVYFDNAATAQKPVQVIKAIEEYYTNYNANIHRGVHYLSQRASDLYDGTRSVVQKFINAKSENEIIFTKGTTEGINLIAQTFGRQIINEGDEIILTEMEHHANIVPWQLLCEEKKATIKVIPINDKGELELEKLDALISDKTKLISLVHISNSLGTINPVKEIISKAHKHNIPVCVDGAQSVVHEEVDVQDFDCDFFVFSSHKMLGPTGVGVLYGKEKWLDSMPPYQGGGDMIKRVSFDGTTFGESPSKFEAGTPNIAGVIGLRYAVEYYNQLDRSACTNYEKDLLEYATEQISKISSVKIWGEAKEKEAVLSFTVDGVNSLDLGMYLDTQGIAVRTGQHCTEPVMDKFGINGTIRVSFMFYNTKHEIDYLLMNIVEGIKLLGA